ncbi:AGAP001353-PA [Anopheles gambiae str. PEST]|uniref:AGAP001353-PA n=1 Tax=Anopheles gambiae TaxID=7165 RepID=A7UVN8_ANOGA|nr:AGAP001353-PA [Anopheles gambiae str. PEST]
MSLVTVLRIIVLITTISWADSLVPLPAGSSQQTPFQVNKVTLELVEKFRQQMARGFPLLDLPVLAPFTWKELHINDFDDNILRLSAKLKDGITRGLDVFDVTALNVQISDRKLDFQLTFPSLQTNGRYEAKGQLAGFVPFDRSGKCLWQLRGLTMHGTVVFDLWRRYLFVRDVRISFAVKSSQVEFENVMLLPWNTFLFNRIVSGQIPEYLRSNRNAIAMKIRTKIRSKLNEILWKYDVPDIIRIINATVSTG